jgi:MFS family permease
MSDAISVAGEQAIWRPAANPWLIAVTVSMAAFMEVLDTAIANVALPHIAGNLGASNDQSTWVLTSYLVANAIVLPITGWLVSVFGRKRFFMTCMCVFTVSSLLCGIAPNLGFLLLFRVLQGAGGGGLQPMAQAILADTFPPSKRDLAFSIYGITAVCAPDLLISFRSATLLRIGQYLPMGFVFVPATTAAYIGIRADKSNAVAGLVNFTRNIGSSVGTSICHDNDCKAIAISPDQAGHEYKYRKQKVSRCNRRPRSTTDPCWIELA